MFVQARPLDIDLAPLPGAFVSDFVKTRKHGADQLWMAARGDLKPSTTMKSLKPFFVKTEGRGQHVLYGNKNCFRNCVLTRFRACANCYRGPI